jgi:hypothetical protein
VVGDWNDVMARSGALRDEQVAPGYRLVVEPDDVDAVRFTRWAAETRRLLVAGSCAGASDLLRDVILRGSAVTGTRACRQVARGVSASGGRSCT